MKKLYVIPGGGSPHNKHYKKVYDLLKEEGKKREFNVEIIDYVGIGHSPDFGEGLNLINAVERVTEKLSTVPKDSLLLARSFGCNVIAYIMRNNDNFFSNFKKIILWGIPSKNEWKQREGKSIDEYNEIFIKGKGLKINDDFFKYINDVTNDIKNTNLKNITSEIILGLGTKDKYSKLEYYEEIHNYLKDKISSKIVEIENAPHEISRDSVDNSIIKEYLEMIFD